MANSVNTQVLENGVRNYVIRAYGILDTADIGSTTLIDTTAAAFQTGNLNYSGNPYTVKVAEVEFAIEDGLSVNFFWDATTPKLIGSYVGRGEQNYCPPAENNAGAGKTGKVLYLTTGWSASAVLSYDVTLFCIKAYV